MASHSKPHDYVYTKLAPSPIHGVGVFALRYIPKGTMLFHEDPEESFVTVLREDVETLPEFYRKLYYDFCVLKDGVFYCPRSFNELTPAWYLNDGKENANVGCTDGFLFYALRDIQPGEELTSNYDLYSEDPYGARSEHLGK